MKKLLVPPLCWFLFSLPANAGLSDLGAGARAPGLAEAFVAVADDASAIYYNPGGLAQITSIELTTEHGEFIKGLSDASAIEANYLGYVQPLKTGRWGTLGLAYHNFKGSNFFSDRMLYLSYAREFNSTGYGLTIKQFHRQYEPNLYTRNALNNNGVASGQPDPYFAAHGYSDDKFGMDLGGLKKFGANNQGSAGAALMNLGHPGDPVIAKAGLSYRLKWGLISTELRRAWRLQESQDNDVALGIERNFSLGNLGALALRGGYGQGSRKFKTVATGFSFQIAQATLDYSFNFPVGNLASADGTHRLALSIHLTRTTAPKTSAPLGYYFDRKAAGASRQERLYILQDLYIHHSQDVDLSVLAKELSSL